MSAFLPFARIIANPEFIFEFPDALPKWAITSGDKSFKKFAFEYGHHAATMDDGAPYFGKMLFLREEGLNLPSPPLVQNICDCLQADILPRIDPNGKFIELQRISVNGQMPTQTPAPHIDTDNDGNLWTAVYYVNDSSGDTVFYKSMASKIEVARSKFQQGKIVVFPACYAHQALAPTEGWRISIGVTFEWHTKIITFKRDYG